jgi:hypothetical protein
MTLGKEEMSENAKELSPLNLQVAEGTNELIQTIE